MQSRFILINLFLALAMLTIGANAVADEKWGAGGSGGVWDALQNSDSSSAGEHSQECEAQAAILRMKSSMQGDCAAAPKDVPESNLCNPEAKSGDAKEDTGGKVTYDQPQGRPAMYGDTVDPAPKGKNDCSSNFSSTCAGLGWELKPGQEWKQATTTAELKQTLGSNGNECWKKVNGKPRAGDMSYYNTGSVGHVIFYFDENTTWESSKKKGKSGPMFDKANGGGIMSDNRGANQARGGIFRFDKKNKRCMGKPKKFKGEEKIKNCPGGKDGQTTS